MRISVAILLLIFCWYLPGATGMYMWLDTGQGVTNFDMIGIVTLGWILGILWWIFYIVEGMDNVQEWGTRPIKK